MKYIVTSTVLLLAVFAFAGDADGWEFQTMKAKAAAVKYERAIEKAEASRDRAVAEATQQLRADLLEAQTDATRAGNLDEAVRIRSAMRQLAADGEHSTKPNDAGLDAIIGKTWIWIKGESDTRVRVRFEKSGVYYMLEPSGEKRPGRWKPVDAYHAHAVNPDGATTRFTFDNEAGTFLAITDNGAIRIGKLEN
ncbi:hypothetical protein HED60_01045 [Planctomycetales bacterium ZRK34]|nr:hypothetical protein HED60_01045 [Planctomycetales bacterium ZRK34]